MGTKRILLSQWIKILEILRQEGMLVLIPNKEMKKGKWSSEITKKPEALPGIKSLMVKF